MGKSYCSYTSTLCISKKQTTVNNIYHFIFGTVFLFSGINFCDCARIENWRTATHGEYEYVDDVFIGDVNLISENKNEYELIVCEVFKGNLEIGEKIKGINAKYCGPIVDKKGQWLFFGKFLTEFKLNECGLSTNIEEPWQILPPPPPPHLKAEEKSIITNWKKDARKMVHEQIIILRNKTD